MPPKKYDEDVVEKLLLKQYEALETSFKSFMSIYDEKLKKIAAKMDGRA